MANQNLASSLRNFYRFSSSVSVLTALILLAGIHSGRADDSRGGMSMGGQAASSSDATSDTNHDSMMQSHRKMGKNHAQLGMGMGDMPMGNQSPSNSDTTMNSNSIAQELKPTKAENAKLKKELKIKKSAQNSTGNAAQQAGEAEKLPDQDSSARSKTENMHKDKVMKDDSMNSDEMKGGDM